MSEEPEDELAELLAEVRRIEAQSKRLVRDLLAGGYTSVFRGGGLEFDEVREYVPGDDPRSVDWNVSARMGRPFVKKFVEEREQVVLFLMDVSESMRGGFGGDSARRMAARVLACLAFAAVANDDKVGLIAYSGGVDKYVPPGKGLGHALAIVRDTLGLRPRTAGCGLAAALELAAKLQRRRAVVFAFSDFLAAAPGRSLEFCARRHDLVAVRLAVPELEPPVEAGLMQLRDPEDGARHWVDWGHGPTRRAYAERVERWRSELERRWRAAGVDRMDVAVQAAFDVDAVVRPILAFFRMREARGAKR